MDKFVKSILSAFDKDPEYAMVKYSVSWNVLKTSSTHFKEAYKERKNVVRNLRWLALQRRQFREDLLDIHNLYFIVSTLLNLSCDCCSVKVDLKPIGNFLRAELTKQHYTDLHSIYFLAFLKIVNNNKVHKEFSPYVQKISEHIVTEYNKKFKDKVVGLIL